MPREMGGSGVVPIQVEKSEPVPHLARGAGSDVSDGSCIAIRVDETGTSSGPLAINVRFRGKGHMPGLWSIVPKPCLSGAGEKGPNLLQTTCRYAEPQGPKARTGPAPSPEPSASGALARVSPPQKASIRCIRRPTA